MQTIRQRIMRTVRMKQYARTQAEAEKLQQRLNAQLTHLVDMRATDYDQPLRTVVCQYYLLYRGK